MKGIVLAGTKSGVGKTVATLVVIRALERDGFDVQPAKAGPDFIDPSHHEAVTDRPSRTLDLWLQGPEGLRRNYYRGATGGPGADICLVEGVMGLYDGDVSSTATVAATLDLPVVLVVDASASVESVGATALGFRRYADHADIDVDVVGVIAQRAGGGRHETGIRDGLPSGLTYVGRIPDDDELAIPDRHLGLFMGDESPVPTGALDRAAETIATERLLEIARAPAKPNPRPSRSPTDATVAVASDSAFRFVYPATIERFRERASVVTFAPVAGEELPRCDGVYLPGGYPELRASDLADSPALSRLSDVAADGGPILGECGGLMVLSESLTTTDDETYEMAGVLPAAVTLHEQLQAIDHVEVRARSNTITADRGKRLRGHEFHYSSVDVGPSATFAFDVERGRGIDGAHDGLTTQQTLGTYCHVHPESGAIDAFVESL